MGDLGLPSIRFQFAQFTVDAVDARLLKANCRVVEHQGDAMTGSGAQIVENRAADDDFEERVDEDFDFMRRVLFSSIRRSRPA